MNQNNYMLDRLNKQKEEIDNLIRIYQNAQVSTPMNVFNVGNNLIDFEARMIGKEENPNEIIVQRRTAFICLEDAKLTIKEVNGDTKEYTIIIPKTPEQLENEELKTKIKDLEKQLKEKER